MNDGGYVMAYGRCYSCNRLFYFNPVFVPSHQNEPICQDCIALVNKRRKAAGLPLWPVPSDAYEPLAEEALR